MELKEILAISGQPGLFKYVAQSQRGVIVESLLDGKRMNASATSRVSALTEISMFTEGDDIALADVFTRIYEKTEGKEAISHKSSAAELQAAFAEVLREATGLTVTLWDERRTTIDAHNILMAGGKNAKQRKKTVDAVAAALMLEGYLTRRKLEGTR